MAQHSITTAAAIVKSLGDDLVSGRWQAKHGHLRSLPSIKCQLRFVVATP